MQKRLTVNCAITVEMKFHALSELLVLLGFGCYGKNSLKCVFIINITHFYVIHIYKHI